MEAPNQIPDDVTWEQGFVVGFNYAVLIGILVVVTRGYAKINVTAATDLIIILSIAGAISGSIIALVIRKIRLNQYLF